MTRGGLGDAARIAAGAPRLWALALAGFLARGGIVLFALPILVVPSVVGIVTFIGPDAVTAAGLSPGFVRLIVTTGALLGAWLALGLVIAVLVEQALIEAVVPRPGAADGTSPPALGRRRLVGRLLAIRVASLVPFGVALAIGSARLFDVGYQEAILPSDVVTPLVARILRGAPDAIAVIVLGWLLAELEGAVASRLAVIEGRSVGKALAGAIGWVIRRPARAAWTTLATVAGSVIVVGPALAAATVAWGLVRDALLGSMEPAATVLATLVFVGVWVGALGVAGIAAAWRSAAWSLAVAGDHRVAGVTPSDGGTL